jgi:quercetin dioxygenase-like cupin family protein
VSDAATEARLQVVDAADVIATSSGAGAQWSLDGERDLDLNVVYMPAGGGVGEHHAHLDVAIVVLSGAGELNVEGRTYDLRPAVIAFVPKGAARSIQAGPEGVGYVTVHQRRSGRLEIGRSAP